MKLCSTQNKERIGLLDMCTQDELTIALRTNTPRAM
jgi:hypothetical protein